MNDPIRPARRARRARAATAALLVAAAAALAGCSSVPESDVLARVGDRVVTAADFRAIVKDNAGQYPFAPDSAKHALLDDMVRRELLLVEGQRLGYDKDTSIVNHARGSQDDVLARALYDRLVPADPAVSDSEVAQLHRWRATKAHLLLIYTPARAAADRALVDLKAGKPFPQVSEQYSMPGVVPPGGDVGWVTAGQLVDPLDTIAREAPVGAPQGPLAAPTEGWFIAIVVERQAQPTGTIEEEKPYLVSMLRQRKQRENAMRGFQQLREQYKVKVEPRGSQLLYQIGSAPNGQAPSIKPTEIIATYDGGPGARGSYTAAEALHDLADPQRENAPFNSTAALEAWIDSQVLQRVAIIEAHRRHLDQEPDVARKLRARVENAVLQKVYEERVAKGVEVTDAEVLARFAQRAAMFAHSDSTGKPVPPPEFAKLPETMQQNFRQEALAMKRDLRLRELADGIRKGLKRYEVHPERLQKLEWPAPQGMPGMPPGGMPAGHP